MKHKIKGRKLNRTSSHRKSLLINLAGALVRNEIIKTTLPKAKELRPFVEKLLTISKVDNLSNRRKLISVIKDKELIKKLFSDIGPRIKERNGDTLELCIMALDLVIKRLWLSLSLLIELL